MDDGNRDVDAPDGASLEQSELPIEGGRRDRSLALRAGLAVALVVLAVAGVGAVARAGRSPENEAAGAGEGAPQEQPVAQAKAPAASTTTTAAEVSVEHPSMDDNLEMLRNAPNADERPWEAAGRPAPAPDPEAPPSAEAGTPPMDEDGYFGWGAAQPPAMTNEVQVGRSTAPMDPARRKLLGEQLDYARKVALEIGTPAEAERRGYHKNYQRIDGRGWEYVNFDYMTTTFNISQPFMLVFEDDKPDSQIISVAYNIIGTKEDGPPKYFPLEMMPWHWHDTLCSIGASNVSSNDIDRCRRLGAEVHPELDHWMIDLWIIPGWENPWGIVSSKHPDMFVNPQPWYADPDYQIGGGAHHEPGM